MRWWWIAAAALAVAGCGGGKTASETRMTLEQDLVIGVDSAHPLGTVGDVAVDAEEQILVLDLGYETIHRFGEDGTFIADVGRAGEGPGEYRRPSCIAVGPHNRIYVAGMSPDVVILEADGTPVASFRRRCANAATSIAVDLDGSVYVVCGDVTDHTMIHEYDGATFQYVRSFGESYAAKGGVPAAVERAYAGGDLAIGTDDRLYFAQWAPQTVQVFHPDGTPVAVHPARSNETPPPPAPDVSGDASTFTIPKALCTSIVALHGGRYLTTLVTTPPAGQDRLATLDLYDSDGTRVATMLHKSPFGVASVDNRERLYVTEDRGVPVLVRYRLVVE